jgi:HEPN domain-containing protein
VNRRDFRRLAEERLQDAQVLLTHRRYSAAYYIAGYAVECGLKACIARRSRLYEFPPQNTQNLYTHDLDKLVVGAKLEEPLAHQKRNIDGFEQNWKLVRAWSEESRYARWSQEEAAALFAAITDEWPENPALSHGVMAWIRQNW